MKVKDAIAQLSQLPEDLDILDEYAEQSITRFYESMYGDNTGANIPYVAYETTEDD